MFSKKGNKEALAGGKGVAGDRMSEVSQTAKVCTDEQVGSGGNLIRHIWGIYRRVSKHTIAKPEYVMILTDVDVTVIDWKDFILPREIS